MLALGQEHAAKMFRMMDDEIRELRKPWPISKHQRKHRRAPVCRIRRSTERRFPGLPYDSAERLLVNACRKTGLNRSWRKFRPGQTNDKLGNVSEGVGQLLKNEYPQTVAVVLSKIAGSRAPRIALLPENFAMEVIAGCSPDRCGRADHVERTSNRIRHQSCRTARRQPRNDGRYLQQSGSNTENRFMTALEERNREWRNE